MFVLFCQEMFPDEDEEEELTKPTFEYDPEIDDAEGMTAEHYIDSFYITLPNLTF